MSLHRPVSAPIPGPLIPRQKLSEAVVIGTAAKSRFHAFLLIMVFCR